MGKYIKEYQNKLRTPDDAVKIVKSGDNISYSHFAMAPRLSMKLCPSVPTSCKG